MPSLTKDVLPFLLGALPFIIMIYFINPKTVVNWIEKRYFAEDKEDTKGGAN